MNKSLLILGVLLAPVASFAVVINFDDIPANSSSNTAWQGNRYQNQNVQFIADGGVLGAFKYSNNESEQVMIGASSINNIPGEFNERFTGKFVSSTNISQPFATDSVSFWVRNAGFNLGGVGSGGSSWEARFYDVNGNELERVTSNGFNVLVSITRPTSIIHSFEFRPSGNNEGIDSLTFNTPQAVPEPASIAAMALGAGALIARRRRKS